MSTRARSAEQTNRVHAASSSLHAVDDMNVVVLIFDPTWLPICLFTRYCHVSFSTMSSADDIYRRCLPLLCVLLFLQTVCTVSGLLIVERESFACVMAGGVWHLYGLRTHRLISALKNAISRRFCIAWINPD